MRKQKMLFLFRLSHDHVPCPALAQRLRYFCHLDQPYFMEISMAKGKKLGEGPPRVLSRIFREALEAVKNMRNIEEEPLPGRTPSPAFKAALQALWELGKGKKGKD